MSTTYIPSRGDRPWSTVVLGGWVDRPLLRRLHELAIPQTASPVWAGWLRCTLQPCLERDYVTGQLTLHAAAHQGQRKA
jgi:hypothetical protein